MTCTGCCWVGRIMACLVPRCCWGHLASGPASTLCPVNALIQHRPPEKDKGGIIAAANLLSFVGIALSAGVYYIFTTFIHLDPRGVILAASAITGAGTVYVLISAAGVVWSLDSLLHYAPLSIASKWLAVKTFPTRPAHCWCATTCLFVDAALLIASTDRPIRFLIYQGIYDNPIVKPFAKMIKAIPISDEQRPRDLIHSLHTASEALRQDDIVCIFAEGQITRTGQLLPFRRGLERIMKDVDVPSFP